MAFKKKTTTFYHEDFNFSMKMYEMNTYISLKLKPIVESMYNVYRFGVDLIWT